MPVPAAKPSIAHSREFVITPEGRRAAHEPGLCRCDWRVLDNMLVCANCFTGLPLKRSTTWRLPEK